MLTVALVVMVIFLFLRSLSATIIPSVAVPLSLVGTFGVMYLLGYSLNNLIADGAHHLHRLRGGRRHRDDREHRRATSKQGEPPLEAALKGAEQIGFTIVSLTVSLIAVLIPLLFMGDIVGRLFREFAVTLAVTILVSAVVSLTLTPMMCARLLRHTPEAQQTRLSTAPSERAFEGGDRVLRPHAAGSCCATRRITLLVAVATLVLTVCLYIVIPKGFFPVQDTGVIQGISEAPQTISFRGHGATAAAAGARHPAGSGRREPVLVHRRRTAPTPR